MSVLKDYLTKLKEQYGEKTELTESIVDETSLSEIPEALREFYSLYSSARFPFGQIEKIDSALYGSAAQSFRKKGWFKFGFDGYFSYWLCSLSPDQNHLSFVSWDHESETEIGSAMYETLIDFLKEEQQDYEENREFINEDDEEDHWE